MKKTSNELFNKALGLFPGGVHSPVRSFKGILTEEGKPLHPIFFKSAQGAFLYSCEGDSYVDFCQSFGPMLLGHRNPEVSKAVETMIQTAWSFGTCEPYSLELAQWIVDHVPSIEKLRFVNSGTEAVMSALRLARGVTGRYKLIKFEGNYHGHVDSLLVKAGSGLADTSVAGASASDSAGVSQNTANETLVLPMADKEAVKRAFSKHKGEISSIILEPLPANFGLLKQDHGFLKFLREITQEEGSLLIFDEVISGFRVDLGGMARVSQIEPDLVTYGKVIGGGFPIGCYGGKSQWMDQVAPAGPVYQAGTLSANPVGMAAGLATLKKIKRENVIKKLEKRTSHFVKKLEALIESFQLPLKISHYASLFWIHNSLKKEPKTIHEISPDQKKMFNQLFCQCLKHGIYLSPNAYEVCFLSLAHTEELLDEVHSQFEKILKNWNKS